MICKTFKLTEAHYRTDRVEKAAQLQTAEGLLRHKEARPAAALWCL